MQRKRSLPGVQDHLLVQPSSFVLTLPLNPSRDAWAIFKPQDAAGDPFTAKMKRERTKPAPQMPQTESGILILPSHLLFQACPVNPPSIYHMLVYPVCGMFMVSFSPFSRFFNKFSLQVVLVAGKSDQSFVEGSGGRWWPGVCWGIL